MFFKIDQVVLSYKISNYFHIKNTLNCPVVSLNLRTFANIFFLVIANVSINFLIPILENSYKKHSWLKTCTYVYVQLFI